MKKILFVFALALILVAPSVHADTATTTVPYPGGHRAPHVAGLTATDGSGWYISNVFPDFGRLVFTSKTPSELPNWAIFFANMNYK